eukprot:gnl/Spiro4/11612_TR6136_c0_g1_i1.p1 gnl/Spiro4/11612_TR6136_c0_g1~~gnl/Spiro4/11612_TR6136_c0_g1_i1.p1  ORF type:complete len:520 (-),score=122.99 gnl/Spiro4/11612_TR6136_c0_g1_i1:256-1815(-)
MITIGMLQDNRWPVYRLAVSTQRSLTSALAEAPVASSATEQDRPPSRFPVNTELNEKICLMLGDITRLQVDAITNNTNENMTERVGVSNNIHLAAGQRLHNACVNTETCRTGEARMTEGFNLPARHVFHTVGPRFNIKYQVAAENALHNCYWSCLELLKEHKLQSIAFCCLNSDRKGYPRDNAVHIAIRSVRRFLEHFGSGISTVIFCLDQASDLELYERGMVLYFPRNEAEEATARRLLPKDTGNEFGETVCEDRVIRIASMPGAGPGGALYESSFDDDYDENCTLPPNFEQKQAFSAMLAEPEVHRLSQPPPASSSFAALAPSETDEQLFNQYLARANAEDLSDIALLNVIFRSGLDNEGNVILTIVACHMPDMSSDKHERCLLYAIKLVDQLVQANQQFVVVYYHNNPSSDNTPDNGFLRHIHNVFDKRCLRTHLMKFYVVHPTVWLRFVIFVLRPFLSSSFISKLTYIHRVHDMYQYVQPKQLVVPDKILIYEATLANGGGPDASPTTSTRPAGF